MVEAGFIFARFLHYAASLALFGISLFPLYAYPGGAGPQPAPLCVWQRRMQLMTASLALLGGLLWLLFTCANMTDTLSGALDGETLRFVLSQTGFGWIWMLRLGLIIATIALIGVHSIAANHRPGMLIPILAAVVLASLAGVGHTQISEGMAGLLHKGADAAHLLAAGAWLGGLLPLGFLLARFRATAEADQLTDTGKVLLRFSGMGYIAVAVLVGSGLINSWFLIGSLSNLLMTPYGQLILLKLSLFASMLLFAILNRFWLAPALAKSLTMGQPAIWFVRLRRHVLGEQILGGLVILIVSVVGTLEPVLNQSFQKNTRAETVLSSKGSGL